MTRSSALALLVAVGLVGGCSSSDSVDRDEVEQKVRESLAAEVGQEPKSVECDEALPAKVDASIHCVLTAQDDSRIGVTVTTTAVDGDDVTIDVQVDNEPMG